MKIITYEEIYRDDMIFMVLQAKDALGRKPTLNPDLLDIQSSYLDCNDMFWLAIDENDNKPETIIKVLPINRQRSKKRLEQEKKRKRKTTRLR